ncbi:DUF1648 domain-containing protein [Oryzomicrobium sp.]|uniref:DUF1648 domain-containing protein n=1 Tax=Oryzomicrobium sp. TaxID=1911578 RepID=UPI002FE13E66
MKPLLILTTCATAFVWATGHTLPSVVASHFDIGGHANSFMPRDAYVWLMLALVVAMPLVTAVIPHWALRNPGIRINIPNRRYWLAPERRAATIDYLARQSVRFSILLLAFLCYVHWLVIQANQAVPLLLPVPYFIAGLVVFLSATLAWLVALTRHFRKAPR